MKKLKRLLFDAESLALNLVKNLQSKFFRFKLSVYDGSNHFWVKGGLVDHLCSSGWGGIITFIDLLLTTIPTAVLAQRYFNSTVIQKCDICR